MFDGYTPASRYERLNDEIVKLGTHRENLVSR
jgi:hypothetical protein